MQATAKSAGALAVDEGIGTIGQALLKELPYVRSIITRLFPEIFLFLKKTKIELTADLDKTYNCTVEDTVSAQLPLALACCLLLRQSFNLPYVDKFAATGTLDPLGSITYVKDIATKKLAVNNMPFFGPGTFRHLFDVLKAMNCLVTRP